MEGEPNAAEARTQEIVVIPRALCHAECNEESSASRERADPSTGNLRIPRAVALGMTYCTTFVCTTGSDMNDACCGERNTFCVAARKSESFAMKMFGTYV